jgi:hypothetical protein
VTTQDNAFEATGTGVPLPPTADFLASTGTRSVRYGFLTTGRFSTGGSFSGRITGVEGKSVTTRVGVYGQAGEAESPGFPVSAGVFGASDGASGVMGWSRNKHGVVGFAYDGRGVIGRSSNSVGVQGTCDSGQDSGVVGMSGTQPMPGPLPLAGLPVAGVTGASGAVGPSLPTQYVQQAGVVGTSSTKHGVIGTSNGQVGVFGFSSNLHGIYGRTNNPAAYAGVFSGNVVCFGTLTASTKNALVPFPDGSQRVLHCMESPEHWFEDFGSAKLARGHAVVKLDADFAKIIKRGDYRVFPAPEGDCRGLYVRRKNASSFEVRELMGGKSSITFSYRIVGRRKDIKRHRRFAKIDTRQVLPTTPPRAPRKRAPTAAERRAFFAHLRQAQPPKGAEKDTRLQALRKRAQRPILPPRMPAEGE